MNSRYRHQRKRLAQGLILLTALLLGQSLRGASPFFSTLSMRDGLPSNIITSISQDKYNFIWVGTGSGLARFDGYTFISFFKRESDRSIPSNEITALIPDGDYIWVGTWGGLCKINVVTFEVTRIDLGGIKVIRTLHKDRNGTIWIGTSSGLLRYAGDTFKIYNEENSNLSHNTVRAIYCDKQQNVWVGTYDRLNKLPAGGDHFVNIDLKESYYPVLQNNLVLDIKPADASDSTLWIGTETGLCLVNSATLEYRRYTAAEAGFSNEVIKFIYTDASGKLWLGTDFGLNVFDPVHGTTESHFHNPQLSFSIANNVIWQIFEDSGGVLWLVTSNGLSRLNLQGNFYVYEEITHSLDDQVIGNQVKSILIASDGSYWLATQHGAIQLDPVSGKKKVFDTNSDPDRRLLFNNVFALQEDSLGRIWIGTASGINVWDPAGSTMYAITSNPANGLGSNYIGKFTRALDGSLWVSAWEGGFYKIHGDPKDAGFPKFVPVSDVGSEKHVSGGNAIWVIEYDELYRVDVNTLEKKHIRSFGQASEKRNVYCLYFSAAGKLWAGTQNGLLEYDPDADKSRFHPIITGNDIIISNIIEDNEGNIWGSTNSALLKFYGREDRQEVFPLDRNIPIKSFYYGCVAKSPSGEIVLGGDNGYVRFSPENVHAKPYKPDVYITAIEINNKTIVANERVEGDVLLQNDISFTKQLTLRYAQRSIAFEFSSLHYWQPSTNVYAYRMDGIDDDWNYVSGVKNFAVYSNLAPGSYRLTVKGSNNYGIWSDKVAIIAITVKPPLFLSTGFLALYGIILIAAVYYALRTYSARVHLKNELKIIRMEKEHAEEIERTKERFFTNISHELRTPISLILPPIQEFMKRSKLDNESKHLIMLAEKNSRRLLRLVNQILDFKKLEDDTLHLKVSALDLVSFCYEVYTLFTDKASRNEIQFLFRSKADECTVWVDPEKIETVLFNLLSNAFKFTPPGGVIELVVGLYQNSADFPYGAFEIKVRDNGIGISPQDQ
ncbi:MAG TPA: two-component regulator propeller domain-containing protein, partial [Cyclobacteriaceae bacterium]